ncbi:hypothetical protein [Streptomyces guryensis]|uniref:Uncharacterized protein n=1 Tax=Streptomyces guryensis TaxID=2886947 RepID=A0A9Q3VY75_9ACTN|nr:hypothetical protein [Streptomyces guryensis]MCD9879917.1 hypothetical protein [Streptomyces guryensis]
MTPPPDTARHGLLAGAFAEAGAGHVALDHQAASAAETLRAKPETIDAGPCEPIEKPSATATPTEIRRTA